MTTPHPESQRRAASGGAGGDMVTPRSGSGAPTLCEQGDAELALFRAAVRGDRAAFGALWSRHRRWVAVVLLAHKPATVELDDLMQEVAMTFVTRIRDVRSPAGFRPWLRMVAVNAARAAARSARLRITRPLEPERPDLRVTPDEIDASERASRLLASVESLPEAYREALMLRSLHEMTTRQIAALLGVPETTVETRVSRARRMLRERESTAERERCRAMASTTLRRTGGDED